MSKRSINHESPIIDVSYENHTARLSAMPDEPGAAMGSYAIEQAPQRNALVLPTQRPTVDRGAMLRSADNLVTMPTNGAIDAGALQAMETVSERSTPVDRAFAFGIVGFIFLGVAGIVAAAMYAAGVPGSVAWILFGLGALVSIAFVYGDSNRYSPTGVELHKANLYADIRTHEIESQERIALRKLDMYGKVLGAIYGNDDK